MQEKNILHGPPEPLLEFKNLSLGQLILNQLRIHRAWVAQVSFNYFSFYYSHCNSDYNRFILLIIIIFSDKCLYKKRANI